MKLETKFKRINEQFGGYVNHSNDEILKFVNAIPNLEGDIIECGVYQGISTAKISVIADKLGKTLYACDSYKGIPKNDEPHEKNIWGNPCKFNEGDYSASLAEAKSNIKRFGKIKSVEFIEGWFEDTLPKFNKPLCAIFLDVDLAESTRTCLKYLYPLLVEGGVLFSHDGHVPLVVEVYKEFAEQNNLIIEGLGKQKLIYFKNERSK